MLTPELIELYGAANMQETDTGTEGGAIDTSVGLTFSDLSGNDNIKVVSSAAGDTTQTVTVTGFNAAGETISEGKQLNGQNEVAMTAQTVWERFMKAVKSATCAGDVAVIKSTAERANTAQSAAARTASVMAYLQLDAGASAVDDAYKDMVLIITGGSAGVGQIRRVVRYTGSNKRAYVKDWGTLPTGTITFKVARGMVFDKSPSELMTIRRPFYDAVADDEGGSAKDYYCKGFLKNNDGTLSLTSAVVSEASDPSGLITFALATALNDTGTSTNRRTVPASGVSAFDSAAKNVANSQNHTAAAGQGVWFKLSLPAGQAAANTSYGLQETGNTI